MRTLLLLALCVSALSAQSTPAAVPALAGRTDADHGQDRLLKAVDDLMWELKLGPIAEVERVRFTSTPPARDANPTAQGAGNPLIITAYTFLPRKLDRSRKQPFVIYVHGGVHANFNTSSANVIRELIGEGYAVIAPDYRGSTGYGGGFYRQIDYGGRENDDVYAARTWMLDTYDFLDPKRVGIIGWSHGGMITLMNIFSHPGDFAVAYAGVPVSDLVARMGYKSDSYRRLFSAPYHIGKSAEDNVQEYLRRSPVSHAANLATPLLIHTNTNDEDVNVLEVQRMIAALKAEGKQFEYKIYENAPGGHVFNRLDTKAARASRAEVYAFLKRHLKP
ncbi:MAG: alpha/beta fold hydrolase [Bryobacteraceae bacterium]|nr:alpha/beta fold hydrolase [Bryobacteraceae bacterium]